MARYTPSAYDLDADERAAEVQLAGLLRSGVLKRFESCWAACLATVEHMLVAHDAFLAAWNEGTVLSGDVLREAAKAGLEESGLAGWIAEFGLRAVPEPAVAPKLDASQLGVVCWMAVLGGAPGPQA